MSDIKSKRRTSSVYVDSSAGFRVFFISLAVACVAGVTLRLYFSPERIKSWADLLLAEQGVSGLNLKFQKVHLALANGSMPEFALELNGVEASPATCSTRPGVRINDLRVPLDFLKLALGRLAIGTVQADGVVVDLDALKGDHCAKAKKVEVKPTSSTAAVRATAAFKGPLRPWWKAQQVEDLKQRLGGLRASHVQLLFEDQTKEVDLDSLAIEPEKLAGSFHLYADLQVPPALVYNEPLPHLHIDAMASPGNADVTVKAALNEGLLEAKALMVPGADGQLETDLKASVRDLPLSTLAPLITKSGLVQGAFHPRFLWMACQVSIRGHFQGLFSDNPLTLEDCQVVGKESVIRIGKAERLPDGRWRPFAFELTNFDVRRLFETFDWQSIDSVFREYGNITGKGEVRASDDGEFEGVVAGAEATFVNRGAPAYQKISEIALKVQLMKGHRLQAVSNRIEIDGGSFNGKLQVDVDPDRSETDFLADFDHLVLNENVERLFLGGAGAGLSGRATAAIEAGHLSQLKSEIKLNDVDGKDYRTKEAVLNTVYDRKTETMALTLKSPDLGLAKASPVFQAAKPLFFAHEFADAFVDLHDVSLRAKVPRDSGFIWENAQANLESGRIRIASAGAISQDRQMSGSVSVDFPLAKKLKWKVSGPWDTPNFAPDSKSLDDLARKSPIDDHVLGLLAASTASSPAKKSE